MHLTLVYRLNDRIDTGDISSNPSAPATPALERHLDATTVPDDVGLKKFRKKKQPQRVYKYSFNEITK